MGRQKKSHSKNKSQTDSGVNKNLQFDGETSYKIQQSESLGRYLIAAKDLTAGEVVISDEPLVVGPCQEAKPLCIGCYVDIDLKNSNSYQRCKNCSWPLCRSNCPGYHTDHGHSQHECNELSKSTINGKDTPSFESFYYAITVLRCLLMKKTNPKNWEIFIGMESHSEQRKKCKQLWETNQKLGVDVIQNIWGLKEYREEEIHFACGVLEVNAFEVTLKSPVTQPLRSVYPKAFLFAHDCVPNTRRSNGQDFKLVVRTTRPIPKNDMITVSYAYTLQSTLMRRRHLRQTKFFSCHCKRCGDPTEFGTYTGAMKCLNCKVGLLLPENPLDEDSVWKCNGQKCSNQMDVAHVIPLLDKLFKELDSIGGNDVIGYETFIKKCSGLLPDNHYLSLSAMHCLSQLYGKIQGYLINDLTDEQLERKEEICRKLIRIFEKFEPGLSKQKGILLYELQAPLMVLLRRRFQSLPKKELRCKIKEVLKYLTEAHIILSTEPETSGEGQMAAAAKEAMTSLQHWLSFLN